ncbi:sulfotransferase family protein [Streptomyces vilmorinianum]|uniref:sulfotransferase-like domain-containing protein n=1 Tax=Streptomyces vilmorinianum TaxID=3051092 RepID=UPI0010FBB291|nr:sulfotransferase family protein [Streptomyces vilmorinianum]
MSDLASRANVLALWSAPRSRSTAFFRMMCERGDFAVLHEPFSYLAEFGKVEVDGSYAQSETELLAEMRKMAARAPLFFKDTTDERYAGVLADERFLAEDAVHTFIIRHPAETIASYHAVNPGVRLHQIGFEAQYELFERIRQLTGTTPVVIDGDDLAADPARVVEAYSEAVGIPYRADTLSWQPESRPEWAPSERWHNDVSVSSGFSAAPRRTAGVDVREHPVLSGYLDHHLPFYEELRAHRLAV